MAAMILEQVRGALRALMDSGTTAFGDGMEETADASRQLALIQSVAMMVGKMAEPIEQDGPLVHWTRQLLQMLEDGTAAVEVEDEAREQFYKAVGGMQSLLGVPEDGRAWVEPGPDDEATALRVQDARELLKPARALVPVFLSVLRTIELPDVDSVCLKALAERLGGVLEEAESAPNAVVYAECFGRADSLLEAITRQMESAPVVLWGLTTGIGAVLTEAAVEEQEQEQEPPFPAHPAYFTNQARHLLAMLLPVAQKHSPAIVPNLRRAGDFLQAASKARTGESWTESRKQAAEALMEAPAEWDRVKGRASYSLWGLFYGIEATLTQADKWLASNQRVQDRRDGAANAETVADGDTVALCDLGGDAGKRADVALGCMIEIQESAEWLLADLERNPRMVERPFLRLIREVKRQACVAALALDDDEVSLTDLLEKAA